MAPAPDHFPPDARIIDPKLVGALLEAAGRYPSAGYHGRAVGLYREALKYWTPETTLLAAEYLWMATESLSRGIVEADAARQSMTPKNLAQLKKVAGPDALYAAAREQTVFRGDLDALNALQEASDGFEHGYMDLPEIRALAEPILDRAAGHLRSGLITVLGLSAVHETALLASDLEAPRPLLPPMRIMRGELRVTDPAASPAALNDAVEMDWKSGPRHFARNADGKLTSTGKTTTTLVRSLPPGVKLAPTSSGIRVQGVSAYTVSDVVVERACSD